MSFLSWQRSLIAELAALRQGLLLRELSPPNGRIDLSSNDYLALNSSGRLLSLLQDCINEWEGPGVGSTASRLVRGHHDAIVRLEEDFAARLAKPAALFFSSGYAANIGALPAILSPRDRVFCDRLSHASLLDGIRLSQARRYYFLHNDLNDLELKLKRYASLERRRGHIWIVTESIFSMDGDSPDLRGLCDLAERYAACIYLDEAHALGLRGQGAGLAREQGVLERIAVSVFPCGKAPGLMGALVCGPLELRSLLINKARSFVYSTALPPFFADLLRRTLKLIFSPEMEPARKHVHTLAQFLRLRLQGLGFSTANSSSQIVPLIAGSEKKALELAQACQESGFDVRPIRPPTVPRGQSRLRLSLQATHTQQDLQDVCEVLSKA